MLDWQRIEELKSEVGDDEFSPILEMFLDEVEGVMMRISIADAARLESDLHFLKGCALNIGFRALGNLAGQGELMAQQGRASNFSIEALLNCYSSSKQGMMRGLTDNTRVA